MATKTLTAHGSAQVDTSWKQYGTGSGKFAATSDYISIPDDTDWDFGAGDFSWEMWVKTPASPSGYTCPMTQVEAGGAYKGFNMHFSGSDNLIFSSSPDLNFSCSKSWSANTVYHIAVCRNGNTWYLSIDGVMQSKSLAYGSYSATLTALSGLMYIGQNPQGFFGNNFTGWIDEVRLSKGIAYYTANFTPSGPFSADAYTVLLCHFDGTNGQTTFTDDSAAGTNYTQTLTETITMTDVILKQVSRVLTETITMTATMLRNLVRTLTETITHTDTFASIKIQAKILLETITHADTLIKNLSRTLIETITQTATFTSVTQYFRTLTETITHTDTVLKQAGRVLTETITHVDTILKSTARVLTEEITHTATMIRGVVRTLTETITQSDVMTTLRGRTLYETITHSDVFNAIITVFGIVRKGFIKAIKSGEAGMTGTRGTSTKAVKSNDAGLIGKRDQ